MEAEAGQGRSLAMAAFVVSVVAVLAMGVAYFLLVPSMLLGIVGAVLGIVGRKRAVGGRRELAVAAICLGLVALFVTPWAQLNVDRSGRAHGRHCALNPSDPDC
jgi:4-hydroxybenzoate polyprenyltransferase